ncbi:MAG: AzlD domain-containing protein [Butyrivibrio sp.]
MTYLYIAVMALVTYLIRVIPLTVFKKKIQNRFIRSFLYYVPYACLAAMTFPAILYSTNSIVSAAAGLVAAIALAFCNANLTLVALAASVAVFVVERIMGFPL